MQEKQVYEKTCVLCSKGFKTYNDEFKCCYPCFKFYRQFGGIKSYNDFLMAFALNDSNEAKERYISFVDNVKKFLDIKGDWRVDAILEDPKRFLDMVKIGEKRKKLKDSQSS